MLKEIAKCLPKKTVLLIIIVVLSAVVFAQNSIIKESSLVRQTIERKKKELALLDYESIEEKINKVETLGESEYDNDRIEAYRILKEAKALAIESLPVETRAVWLDDQALGKIGGPDELRAMMKWLNDLNINTILPCVYFGGETIYESKYGEQTAWYRINFHDEDPFQIMIDEARKYGMEIHPWVMVYAVHGNIEPFLDRIEWIDKNQKGQFTDANDSSYFFSPAHPEVSEFLLSIFKEVAEYDIDGIHLDTIRYKDGFGYGDYSVNLYMELFNEDPREFSLGTQKYDHYREFKAQFIASFVEHVRKEMYELDPHIMVSGATAPRYWGKNSLGQDWHNWIDNRSLHLVFPMSYSADPKEYGELLDFDLGVIDGRTYVYPGMTLYAFTPEIMQEEWLVGQTKPMTGQTFFSLLHIKSGYFDIAKNGIFRDKATVTFRDPQNAAVLYLDWLYERMQMWGSYAGIDGSHQKEWLSDFNDLQKLILAAPGDKYGVKDLREHAPLENSHWLEVLGVIDEFILKARKLEEPTRARLLRDFKQFKSIIAPLEYTTRPFKKVSIKY